MLGLLATLAVAATGVTAAFAHGRDQPSTADQAAVAGARRVDDLIAPVVKSFDVPAMAGLELKGDRVVAIGAAGVRELGRHERVSVFDQWHLGSDTKAMTATLCAMLVEEGKLRWDSTLEEIFPQFRRDMRPEYRRVTLQELLHHRSGFPTPLPDGMLSKLRQLTGSPAAQRLYFVQHIVAQSPIAPPGTKFQYSNTNYMIAGAMAEQVTGESWEDLITRKLFDPLQMHSTGFGAPGTSGIFDEPRGHTDTGEPVEPGPGGDNPVALWPAGGVHCTLIDWAKFASLHLNDGRTRPGLLTRDSFAKLHNPIPEEPGGDGYAMGWIVCSRDWAGGTAYTHTGSNTLWVATVWMAPNKDFAILVACNRAGPKDVGAKACDNLVGVLISDYEKHGER
jgi:CubicO group peptidase (beta-lactamase class C family)